MFLLKCCSLIGSMHYVAGKYAGLLGSVLQTNEMGEISVFPALSVY